MDDRENPMAIVARYQQQAPINLDGIANGLGIAVTRTSLGSSIAGRIAREGRQAGPSGYRILVNSDDHPNRQRFTLAHELAHYILHRDLIESGIIDDTMYRSTLNNALETQANRLAADILMPLKLVRRYWDLSHDPAELARRFGVSQSAMTIRLKSIPSSAVGR